VITAVRGDWWEGPSDLGAPVPEPSWQDCHDALAAMDQDIRSSVAMLSDTGWQLAVSGGSGRYMIEIMASDHTEFWRPVLDDSPDEEALVAGGQRASYAKRHITDWDTMIDIAEHFFATEDRHPGFEWVVER
jgi:Immunity protein Imm1